MTQELKIRCYVTNKTPMKGHPVIMHQEEIPFTLASYGLVIKFNDKALIIDKKIATKLLELVTG